LTRTSAFVLTACGSVQAYVPSFASPVAIVFQTPPLLSEYSSVTDVTATLSDAVHVMLCSEPAAQVSPPFGVSVVTVGATASPAGMTCSLPNPQSPVGTAPVLASTVAFAINRVLSCAGVWFGCSASRSAQAPVTCGDAIDVPASVMCWPSGLT